MKKVFVGLFLITSCISAEGQVAFCYNNKDYLVNENNIVLDSLDNSYTYEEWQKLYNTGNYGLVPVVPGYEKTLFRLVRMSEEDKKKYYSDIKKPLETNFFKTGTTFDFFRGRDMDGNIINAKKLGWYVAAASLVLFIQLNRFSFLSSICFSK